MFNSGSRGKRARDGIGLIGLGEHFNQQTFLIPTVNSFTVTDVSYVPLDDTTVDPAGGQTIIINGSGFAPGATVLVGSTTISVVTFLDQNRLSFIAPALSSGSYTVFVTNSGGGTGILVPGLVYSGFPTYLTPAGSIGSFYETTSINESIIATSDSSITYSLLSGSLPSGSTLSANGLISGTAPVDNSSTTYSFTVDAIDSENQNTTRAFTLTINTDVVTWSSPENNNLYELVGNAPMSNVTLSATSAAGYGITYTANTLPANVFISGSTIYGTPNTSETIYTTLTATAATTGRSAVRYVGWTISLNDFYFKYNNLLLNSDSLATPFDSDASINYIDMVATGAPVVSSMNPYTEGYYSNYFDGTGDYLSGASNTNLAIGTEDFTIEFWAYWTAAPGASTPGNVFYTATYATGGTTTYLSIYITSTAIQLARFNTASDLTATSTETINSWNHYAITRKSGTAYIFKNGVLLTSGAVSTNYTQTGFTIGGQSSQGHTTGYISNLRVIKGTAVYTSAFTPPTSQLTTVANTSLLTCQSNRFIDNSNNVITITKNGDTTISQVNPFLTNVTSITANNQTLTLSGNEGSTYFPTTSDYLVGMQGTANSAGQIFGTGDFTVDCWLWATNAGTTTGHNISRPTTLTNTWYLIHYNSGIIWGFNGSNIGTSATGIIPINAWSHIAVSRVSGVTKGFLNGVEVFSITDTNNYSASPARPIGPNAGGAALFYLSNFRIIKGTGLYSSAFTAPYLPASSGDSPNTALLMCQTKQSSTNSLIVDNSSFKNLITRSGNASLNSLNPYGSNWSAYFDGTGDYLTVASSTEHGTLGTSDFTLELWFNTMVLTGTSGSGAQYIISHRLASVVPYLFWIEGSGALKLYASSDNGSWNLANQVALGTVAVNQWYHLAYTRSGSTFRVFLNGTQVHTFTSSASLTATTNTLNIGGSASDTNSIFYGYISNVRFVKGTSLYDSAFTPSTSPLTAVANTTVLTCQSNSFVDNSPNNLSITKVADASVQKYSPFNNVTVTPSTYSALFNGSGYAIIPSAAGVTPIFGLGTNDFTIECWFFVTNTENNWIWDLRYSGSGGSYARPMLFTTGSNVVYNIGNTGVITGTGVVTTNKWYHAAIVKIAGSTKLYINGTQVGSTYTTNDDFGGTNTLTIGSVGDSPGYSTSEFNGSISNLRIVRNIGVYTGNFTPPTSKLTVTQSAGTNIAAIPEIPVYGGSVFFDGTGDYLTVPSNAAFAFGTGDFTVEFWAYPTVNNRQDWIDVNNGTGPRLLVYYNGTNIVYNASNSDRITGPAMALNTWQHIAVSRVSGSTKLFINGTQVGSTYTDTTNYSSNQPVYVGKDGSGSTVVTGYMSNIRILKGTGLYTANTSTPTSPLTAIANTQLLIAQSTSIVDRSNNVFTITAAGGAAGTNSFSPFANGTSYLSLTSSNIFEDLSVNKANTATITATVTTKTANPFYNYTTSGAQPWDTTKYGGSVYFDGTGDYLTVSSSSAFAFGTGDFTIEFWAYPTVNARQDWFDCNGGGTRLLIYYDGTNINYFVGSTTAITGSTMALAAWQHIALCRVSGSTRLFINGTQVGSTYADSNNFSTNQPVYIGKDGGGTTVVTGFMSNVRVVKGTGLYTSTFYPPAAPTTTVNDVLLINNAPGIPDYSMTGSLETLGQVKSTTSNSPYYENYSNYFDGTGDYLDVTGIPVPSTGQFTIEAWIYTNKVNTSTNQMIYSQYNTSDSNRFTININTSNKLTITHPSGNITGATTVPPYQWNHIAVTRDASNTLRIFLNGVIDVSSANWTNSIFQTNARIGYYPNTPLDYFNGYISNLRVLSGTALYTANTTPPTSTLTAIANTSLLTCQSNRFIDKSTNAFTLTRTGDTKVTPFQPFVTKNTTKKSSMLFDGSGDYLYQVSTPNYAFGTGDFTIEFWTYPTVNARQDWLDSNDGTNRLLLYYSGSNITYYISPTIGAAINGGAPIFGAWNHIALVRSSGISTLYLNGSRVGATYSDTKNWGNRYLYIGKDGAGSTHITGNMTDLRISRYARYTSNTTPPTTSHTKF
jgi:hypothetical protein